MTEQQTKKLNTTIERMKQEDCWTYYIKVVTLHYGTMEKKEEIYKEVMYRKYDKAFEDIGQIIEDLEEDNWKMHAVEGSEIARMVDESAQTLKIFEIQWFKTIP